MKGLSLKAFEAIERMIKNRFDSVSMKFLGLIPQQAKSKQIIFTTSKDNMISLFLQALGSKDPSDIEEQTLKTMMRVASGYLDALRDRSAAKIMHDVDSYITNQSLKEAPVSVKKIDTIINKEMDKAGKHLKLIVNSESNKAANTGTALQISKIADEKGESDPTVFFIVTIDERNDPETYRLHLLPDRLTPRVYKLSELGSGYHKKGDPWPKIIGTNPNCRCHLTYLSKGWGFQNGKISFKNLEWDEYKYQREKFGLPNSIEDNL